LVGYARLSGLSATAALAGLYRVSRLYGNVFQPSFKLKAKTRDGAPVRKTYHAPATPYQRLQASNTMTPEDKASLTVKFASLDPVELLRDMHVAQQVLADLTRRNDDAPTAPCDVTTFLAGLATAWKEGEVRPVHRRPPAGPRWWRSRVDPFEHSWPVIEGWLNETPTATAGQLMDRLALAVPDTYASKKQLRTLQRRIKTWWAERIKEMILGSLATTLPETVE
jgi:hypothetical protein